MRSLPLKANELSSPILAITPARTSAQASDAPIKRIDSRSLLDGTRELVIEHQGAEYHLRLTRNDKLILTK